MAKFNKRGGNATGSGEEGERRKSGRSAYKAKRSFTRNKSHRDKEKDNNERPARRERDTAFRDRPFRTGAGRDKTGSERKPGGARRSFAERENDNRTDSHKKSGNEKKSRTGYRRPDDDGRESRAERNKRLDPRDRRGKQADEKRVKYSDFEKPASFRKERKSSPKKTSDDGLIRLNKYLSNAGIASRRDADDLIKSGAVKVNGVVVDQLGYKIKPGDRVNYGDEAVKGERKVYLLVNKPKDYITTVEDPRDRKTVMELIAGACRERVYPVGRLDRNTTGILLFTNDGELTTKLTHPRYNVKKVYHVTLDKNLKTTDFKALVDGIELEDGPVRADDLAFVGEGKRDIGVEIHSGRNRIVRRMFEHLGYKVVKLDRVVFAGLTKKDLPRGKYRFLTPKEVAFLKMLG